MPPEELYLRELIDLDLADGQAICEFTRRYGRLETHRWASLPQWYVENWRRQGDAPELDAIDQLLNSYRGTGLPQVGTPSHLELFRLYARILRDAVRLWTASVMTGSIQSALDRWESYLPKPQAFVAAREAAGLGPSDGEAFARHQASEFLVNVLSPALVPYHPRFEMTTPGVKWQLGVPDPGLYSAMVLQLYNHIAEGSPYSHCANCDRLFVRQRDRAEQGRYRTEGLMYCSKNCAWAAGQRKWRQKQRKREQARDLHADGVPVTEIADRLGIDLETLTAWLLESHEGRTEDETR